VLKWTSWNSGFDDYEKDYAKTVNKPIMLDFTGYACEL
jgi:hypothetical protein